jgi:hypothetical protein
MRGDNKMITADFVNEAISKVVERFNREGCITFSYDDIWEDEDGKVYDTTFYIEDEIDTLLSGLNVLHRVELVDVFENPGIEIKVVCVSFVVNGELCQHNVVVEFR